MKTKYGAGLHVSTDRLAAFLIDGISLTAIEREHVMDCRLCTQLMRIAASEELRRRRTRRLSTKRNPDLKNHLRAG